MKSRSKTATRSSSTARADIDCKYSAVPTGIIPAPIAKYVADNYPDNKIVQIERDTRSTEVKLDNRMEIKFDKQHRVIEMDF